MELRQYLALIGRWWWLLILAAIVAAATSYLVSQRIMPVYEASTTLIVGQSIQATELSNQDILTSERLAQTYAAIALQQPVMQAVVETLNLNDPWRKLRERVKVTPVRDTQLLRITVEANHPETARMTADEVAHQLILLSPTTLQKRENSENQRFVRQRLESLQTKIEAGQSRVQELEGAMAGSLTAEQVDSLQDEINTLEKLMTGWESTYTQLLIFSEGRQSPNYLAVTEPAQAKLNPIRPRVQLNTLLAGIVGFLLALGLIFLLEYLDDTIKSADELSQALSLTTLGSVSRIKGKQIQNRLLAAQDSFDPVVEAYRMIRSNIQFASVDRPANSILVTSSVTGEGKSTTAANIGIVMAQGGLKTIVVDTDMRRPMQQYIFQTPSLGGLSELFRSPELEVGKQLIDTSVENLQLLPCGVLPPNPAELLGSQRMSELLARLAELADVVIYDSPPALVVTDAAVLSGQVDGVILVVEAGKTRREAVQRTIADLQRAGANLLGGVLNRVSKSSGDYYYQGYYATSRNRRASDSQPASITPGISTAVKQTLTPKPRRSQQRLPFLK